MTKIIDDLKNQFTGNLRDVIKDSFSSILVKTGGLVAGLLVSVFLGRTLGADGFGVISLANRIASIVLVFCLLGMRQVIIKEVSIGYSQKNWGRIGNVMYSSYLLLGGVTLVVSVLFVFLSPSIANSVFNDSRLVLPLIITFSILVPQVYSRIFSSGLIGFKKIWQSNLVDNTLSITIVGVLLTVLWLLGIKITIISVIILYAIGRVFVALSTGLYFKKLFNNRLPNKFIGRRLLKTSAPLILVGASAVVSSNADSVMLGWLNTSREVGLYVVAAKVALLTSFFLQVTNSAIAPRIATLFNKQKIIELETLIQKITLLLIVIAILPVGVFFLFGEEILSIWGVEFIDAYWILIIISIGQFFNLSTGAAGLTLILCGEERVQGVISVSFVLLNLILNYFLIITYGAVGAAIATALTVAGENITRVILVKKRLGILTIPVGFHLFR